MRYDGHGCTPAAVIAKNIDFYWLQKQKFGKSEKRKESFTE